MGMLYVITRLTKDLDGHRDIDYFMLFFRNVVLKHTNLDMMNGRGGEITRGILCDSLGFSC